MIAMATLNDVNVSMWDWVNLFMNQHDPRIKNQSPPAEFWGFKDAGMHSPEAMQFFINTMKQMGKKVVMESVLGLDELGAISSAMHAVDYNVDYLIGTNYSQIVHGMTSLYGIQYFPFLGNVTGHPSQLSGDIGEMREQAHEFAERGVQGVNILAYRHKNPDAVLTLANEIQRAGKLKTIIAGGINSDERLRKIIDEIKPFGYTVGGALFEK